MSAPPTGAPDAPRTVRLACAPGTWVVSIEGEVRLVTDNDDEAWSFAMNCLQGDSAPGRLLVSSGPEVAERIEGLMCVAR